MTGRHRLKGSKSFWMLCALIILMAALVLNAGFAFADSEEGSQDQKTIIIEEVEDIPAADIEDSELPLSEDPGSGIITGNGIVLLAGALVVIAVICMIIVKRRNDLRIRSDLAAIETAFAINTSETGETNE